MHARRSVRGALVLIVALSLACAALALLGWGLAEAFREEPGGTASAAPGAAASSAAHGATTAPVASTSPGAVTADEVRAWIDAALPALERQDRIAWRAALPVRGSAARRALADLYGKLSPIPWTGLQAEVHATPGYTDRFDIQFVGRPGGAGPPTRLVADRLLEVTRGGEHLVATGDPTPPAVRHQYFMAFHTPHATVAPGVVVISDDGWLPLAKELAGDMPQARADIAAILGVTGARPVVVFVYSSSREIADAIGVARAERNWRFFSSMPEMLTQVEWWPGDVSVLGPAVPTGPWTAHMLAHEVTHGLTRRWFFHTAQAPPLLLEGLATAVENDRSYQPLKNEIAAGNRGMPLLESLASGDLWSDPSMSRVQLGYLEGGSLVKYILAMWGKQALHRVSVDIAQTDLSDGAVKNAVTRDLRMPWSTFYTGWKAYVMTLP
jgi:hypothetical protein